jgi:signal transduction histidine kinase
VLRLLEAPENFKLTAENSRDRLAPGELAKVQELLNSSQDALELDVRMKTFTGKELTVRVVARVERRNNVIWRMVGAILDVTEHRQLEASVRLNDRLAAMGTIAAGVAHEINNPLTHLVASLPLVLEAVKKHTSLPHEVEMLEGCIEGAQRIAAIVRDLRVFSRPDESEADTEVGAVLTSVLNLLNLEYRHRSSIHSEVPIGLKVAAPSARLAQVLTNLIINAVQAMPANRAPAQNLIKVVGSAERGTVTIEVSDNGSGMSAEVKARLFAPFFTTKPVGEGTGLGLSVVRSIITGLNGSIEVESAEGLGTRFIVKLPEGKRAAEPVPATSAPQANARPLRLLLVDDEPFLRRVTHRLLQPHEVVEASSADEGLSILARDQRFDVILCDLMMPGRSGTDFYRDLSARSPQLANRFLFVSGGAVTAETEAFLREVTPDRVVLKPYTYVQLHSAVERVAAQQH